MQELVKAACPHCGQQYRVGASQLGQTARCKKCGGAFPLGGAQQATPLAQPSPPEAPGSGNDRKAVLRAGRARTMIGRARCRWSALSFRSKAAIGAVAAIVLLLLVLRPFAGGTTTAGDYTSAEVNEIISLLRDDLDTKHGLIRDSDSRAVSLDLWKAVLGKPEGVGSLAYDDEIWTYKTRDGAVTVRVVIPQDGRGKNTGPIAILYPQRGQQSVALGDKSVDREALKSRIMVIKARVDKSLPPDPYAGMSGDEVTELKRQRAAAEQAKLDAERAKEQAEIDRQAAIRDEQHEGERDRWAADGDYVELRDALPLGPQRQAFVSGQDDWVRRRAKLITEARRSLPPEPPATDNWSLAHGTGMSTIIRRKLVPLPSPETLLDALRRGEAAPVTTEPQQSSPAAVGDASSGFVSLFDGETLADWTPTNGDGQPVSGWTIRDGAIICESSEVGWLQSPERYGDFDLRMEVRADRGDSGVLIRIGRANVQVEVCEDRSRQEAEKRAGAVWGVAGPEKSLLKPLGEWNALRILCQGRRVTVWVNGTQSADVNLDEHPQFQKVPDSGPFGLFNYHGAARGCEYRNIRIRSLPAGTDPR